MDVCWDGLVGRLGGSIGQGSTRGGSVGPLRSVHVPGCRVMSAQSGQSPPHTVSEPTSSQECWSASRGPGLSRSVRHGSVVSSEFRMREEAWLSLRVMAGKLLVRSGSD